jgi:TIR domain/Interferon-induced transmembrane protein
MRNTMSTATELPAPRNVRRRLFISYAREDQKALEEIRAGIMALHHEAWVDSNLEGGQSWWDVILEQIRTCDAMILVVSPSLIDSEAARRERSYARALQKQIIPLVVTPVRSDLLPPDIATLQFIDYTKQTPLTGAMLANVLYSLPTQRPLPDPLPEPPAVPVSYLGDLADMLRRPSLSVDEQLSIAARLAASLERTREHDAALELLLVLEERHDLFHITAREVIRIRRDDDARKTTALSATSGHTASSGAALDAGPDTGAGKAAPSVLPVRENRPEAPPPPITQPDHREGGGKEIGAPPDRPSDTRPPVTREPGNWQPPRDAYVMPDGRYQSWPAPMQPPKPHWALSITALLLGILLGAPGGYGLLVFLPLGIVGLVFSSQTTSRWAKGDAAGAARASGRARLWAWIAIGVEVLLIVVAVILVASYSSLSY